MLRSADGVRRETTYLFIDGGYLDTFATNAGIDWFGVPAELDYESLATTYSAKRTFYYDCLPAKNGRESDAEHLEKRTNKEKFFDSLRAFPGWHVSEGLAKWRKREGSTQKEVDILIAVDMLTHTYRQNMDAITFIAGDLDFRPLVEAVVREGMYINLIYGKGSIAKELKNSVDKAHELGPFELYDLCTDGFRRRTAIPQRNQKVGSPNGTVLQQANLDGQVVALLYAPDDSDHCHKIAKPRGEFFLHYRDTDVRRLKAVFAAYHGPVEWSNL